MLTVIDFFYALFIFLHSTNKLVDEFGASIHELFIIYSSKILSFDSILGICKIFWEI
jgi:hypothetical protein